MDDIKTAFDSGIKTKVSRAAIRFNAEVSYDEMKNITSKIKEQSLKKYLDKKVGLKPFEYIKKLEKSITNEKKKLKLKGTKLEDWL